MRVARVARAIEDNYDSEIAIADVLDRESYLYDVRISRLQFVDIRDVYSSGRRVVF